MSELFRIEHGDCLDLAWREPPESCDSLVTDPPAAIRFMGRAWDSDNGGRTQWIRWLAERIYAAQRLLEPGAHALIWALPRTSHWTGMAIEDGGLEIRDCIHHAFGSGMPKSKNLGGGRGTGLKPAHELWFLCRKPIVGTTTANVAAHGTGGLNIDACRVNPGELVRGGGNGQAHNGGKFGAGFTSGTRPIVEPHDNGRWPPNFVMTHSADCKRVGSRAVKANPTWDTPNRDTEASSFTGSEVSQVRHASAAGTEEVPVWECVDGCPVKLMDEQSGDCGGNGGGTRTQTGGFGGGWPGQGERIPTKSELGSGSASRFLPQFEWSDLDDIAPFLYEAKASKSEKERGLEHFRGRSAQTDTPNPQGIKAGARNVHPTIKNHEFMKYATRLITPPRGRVLDIFTGSGSTGVAALAQGFEFLGFELNDTDEEPFVSIARARCAYVIGREFVPRESLLAENLPLQRSLFA